MAKDSLESIFYPAVQAHKLASTNITPRKHMDLTSAYLDHIDPTGIPGDLCAVAAIPLSKAVSILGLKRLPADPSHRATFKIQHGADRLTLFTLYFDHADAHGGIELAIAATPVRNRSSSTLEDITKKPSDEIARWTKRLQNLGDISAEHAHPALQDFPRVVFSKPASAEAIFDAIHRFVSSGDSDISEISPEAAQEIWDSVRRRQGQDKFRSALLRAYEGRCAISGCNVEPALEAAHIRPYFDVRQHEPDNGLLLRADIHTLFDFHLISIDASKRIVMHPDLTEAYPMLANCVLADPDNTAYMPNPEHLAAHYERFRAKLGQRPSTPSTWKDI